MRVFWTNMAFGILAAWIIWRQVAPVFGVRRVSAQRVASWLREDPVPVLVDVRHRGEFESGHIATAQSIPLREIRARLAEIPRDRTVVLVCRSGYRAMQAYHILQRRGYTNHFVLTGGMLGWQARRHSRGEEDHGVLHGS